MPYPMHLHRHFFQLDNGTSWGPLKDTVLVVVKDMASIPYQLYHFEWKVLPEWRDDLTNGISFWLVGSARCGTSTHWTRRERVVRNSGIGVAINHLYFSSPLAFEL